jgi:bifunctional DNA-binding transcriptional regulator/antitoxin component of YhaV-PrlF toxin-antitoxin module
MRLQRSVSRRVNGKEYIKFQLVIPNEFTSQLGWNGGDFIQGAITRGGGFLLRKTEPKQQDKKPSYCQFRDAVASVLIKHPGGTVWTTIVHEGGLAQKTPSPIYVRKMEQEGMLERQRDAATSQVIWKPSKGILGSTSTLNGWTRGNLEGDAHE